MDKKNSPFPKEVSYAEKLYLSDLLRESLLNTIIHSLDLPEGSRGLDIGCGTGSNTLILADAVGPSGHVTGMDLSPELLTHARQRADDKVLSRRISFLKCDMKRPAFYSKSFDWVWSADCLGFAPGDTDDLIKTAARLLKPGGIFFICVWTSQQLLPGYPVLEARLNATDAGIAPFVREQPARSHVLRAAGWFKTAGLKDITVRSFVTDIQAPLDKERRRAMASLFDMRWGDPGEQISTADLLLYRRLCMPDSPDFLPNRPDFYGFFTYTLFSGRKTV